MGSYILCQQQKAGTPYYIENISTNIFSIEELCFYFYHNIYLLDGTIINEELCRWIGEELGMKQLAARLRGILETDADIGAFILPVFKEAYYLSQSEYKEMQERLQKLQELPAMVRKKLKGDYLVRYGKYSNGIKVYESILESTEKTTLGSQFEGGVYHNMGCAYAKLFQMDEAFSCLKHAYELLHSKTALKSYLYAVYIAHSKEAYEDKVIELGVDAQTKAEMDQELQENSQMKESADAVRIFIGAQQEKKAGNPEGYYRTMDGLLEQMTEDYHRNTGF